MVLKFATLIILALALGATVLSMRQHRIATANQMIQLHRTIHRSHCSLWDSQLAISRQLEPDTLLQAIAESSLQLEPITPGTEAVRPMLLAHASDHRRAGG